jgi:putative transposase
MKVEFVDSQREEHGVQPVLEALKQTPAEIAPSTYYAARSRPESARAVSDRVLAEKIEQVHEENYGVYGARKVWAELNRHGVEVARCTVERLMREIGLRGLLRDRGPRTTRPAPETGRPTDLVDRDFTATRVNELWVADITYVRTAAGWVYAAFVLDVFSRVIVGWQVATSLYTDLALDALQMAIWRRQAAGTDLAGLVHHSDRGVQYRAVRYTQRLAEADAVAPLAAKEIPTTTRWRRRSTRCTRPNSSATAAPGAASTTWKSRPWSTSTGTTTGACTASSDTSHPPNTKHYTQRPTRSPQPWKPANPLSTKPGA